MLIAAAALRAGDFLHLFHRDPVTGANGIAAVILFTIFSLNLLLGTFNLLPVPPLDGSTGVMLLMTEKQSQSYLDWLRENPYAQAGLLVGLVVFYQIYPHVQAFAFRLFF
jgi:Zn-dependent protease